MAARTIGGLLVLHVALFALPGCTPAEGGASDPVAAMNQGVALLEQYNYSEASKVFGKLARAYPAWVAAHVNLGLAALNLQNEHLLVAERELTRALELDSRCVHALVARGMLYQHTNKPVEMLRDFEAAAALDPADPHVLFQKAVGLLEANRLEEARALLEAVVKLQPSFASAHWRLREVYVKSGDTRRMTAAIQEFQRLEQAEAGVKIGIKYSEGGKYSLAIRGTAPPGWKGPVPPWEPRPLAFGARVPIAPGRLPATVRPDGTTAQPTFVLADLTGDGALEVVLPVGGEGQGAAAVFSEDPPGAWREVQRLPVDAAACAAGDIDGDFDADLVLAGSGWLRFFENDGTGRLAEKALQVRGAAHGGFPVRLVCADLDSDWDLDVACLRQEAGEGGKVRSRIEVLNNNLNGTFLDISAECGTASLDLAAAELVAADLDGDIDADLLVIDGRSGAAVVFANDRMWRYRRVEVAARAPGVASAAGGDLDGDGDEDLVLFCGEALRLWRNDGGLRFEEDEAFAERFGALGGSAGVVADLQGALRPSALVLDARSEGRGPAHIPALDAPAALPLSLEGLSGPGGRSAAFTVTSPGKPPALIVCDAATGAAMYPVASPAAGWLVLDLAGPKKPVSKLERANAAGVGASVEVRAGLRGAVFRLHGGAGGGGRPSARVACGLGGAASADYVRILWPDGILQAERGLAPGKLHRIQEVERKPTSCPILFAWTQGGWELVADFLGVGGLGYLEAKDSYSRPDPTEYVLLPPLEPLEGRYRLDVLEPLEECTYLDELKLTVVDHPEDVTVLPEEMFAVRGPAPGFRLLAFRGKLHPESARDQSGQLVTGELREADRLYGNRVSPDPRFPGLARESHWIELDFGAGIADLLAKGGPSARPYLFLHGYVEYGYSTSNFAAWQAGETFRAPTVLAERGDAWVPLREEWGFPAGYPRTMTVDLAGVLEPGDRKLRVATNMVIHWDQAFLADAGSGGGVKTQDLDADAASLSFRGYPPEESPDGSHPALYAYRDLESEAPFKVFPGAYTRYGDVRELLGAADDRFAILGPGDGLEVEVRADRLPPVAPGMRRTFLARTVGYCKDMDPYTAHPERVEPLPFRAMSGYPYGPAEAHPATPEHETYRRRWNTRVVE